MRLEDAPQNLVGHQLGVDLPTAVWGAAPNGFMRESGCRKTPLHPRNVGCPRGKPGGFGNS